MCTNSGCVSMLVAVGILVTVKIVAYHYAWGNSLTGWCVCV